jgi:N-methylhydantoinase A/oxoprolinase/acetone carboxylase beta subunit
MASVLLARLAGLDHVVSFDMGGTTAKMCLVENRADRKFDFEAGRVRRFQKGSGLPLKVSVVDMIEIGAGGGIHRACRSRLGPDEGRPAQRGRRSPGRSATGAAAPSRR